MEGMRMPGNGRRTSDEALNRALAVLERSEGDEREIDAALSAIVRMLPAPAGSAGFVRRAMRSVREAPLAKERRPLAEPVPLWGRAAMGALGAAGSVWLAASSFGLAWENVLSRLVAFLVHAELSVLASANTALRVGRTLLVVSEALAGALGSPPLSLVLMVTAGVGGVSLLALVRLLSGEQESLSWPDRSSLV
jgi:hypothetical protein